MRWNNTDKPPTCRECDTICELSPRLTWYCPSCDVCSECNEPQADGNWHDANCPRLEPADVCADCGVPVINGVHG